MIYFEYAKFGKEFLITDFEDGVSDTVKIRFINQKDGALQIGAKSTRLENGTVIFPRSSLAEGVHTPIFHTDSASFICDRIKVEAGKVLPLVRERQRVFELTSKLTRAEEKINALEARLTELCSKVYAKNIF